MSTPAPTHDGSRVFSSPLARRLAKNAGIEVSRIQGSGPHGRVVARDVEAAQSGKGLKAPGASPGAAYVPPAGPSDQQVRALFGGVLCLNVSQMTIENLVEVIPSHARRTEQAFGQL